jgi:transposase
MKKYKIIGIDLAKTKFHLVAINDDNDVVMKKSIKRKDFFERLPADFPSHQTFAFEACGGAHYTAQKLQELGHQVILLKPRDVKPYAKSRQKNDINDAIAICRASLDPNLMHVRPKSKEQQEISYLHKSRQNIIQQRIQRSNSILTSLQEFGYVVQCGKSSFAKECISYIDQALEQGFISLSVHSQMLLDCKEIACLLEREKVLAKELITRNKHPQEAQLLETIPGIGPINASILSNKPMESYTTSKDFAASLGLVPKQNTTGGDIRLGSITKQGDRYARTMLIQAGRVIVMRSCKPNMPQDKIYLFAQKLKKKGKPFNLICVAVANKLARIAYACVLKKQTYAPLASL